MPPATRILLVHVSDLHFGSEVVLPRHDWISGYHGHDHRLCVALPGGIESAPADIGADSTEQPVLVISGALTVSGTRKQFSIARRFVRRSVGTDDLSLWELASATGSEDVPGNHDHWAGRMPRPKKPKPLQRAFSPAIFPDPFIDHPWSKPITAVVLRLEHHGVDSQSGFDVNDTNLRARGSISPEQISDLQAEIDRLARTHAESERVVRCLVTRHPLESAEFEIGRLDHASCQALGQRLTRNDFATVLVGHAHAYRARPVPVDQARFVGEVLEIRVPSALQGKPRDGVHGFVLHEIAVDEQADVIRGAWHPCLWAQDAAEFRKHEPECGEAPVLLGR